MRKVPQGWGKNHSKGLEETVFEAYTGPGMVLIFISQTGRKDLLIPGGTGVGGRDSEGFCLSQISLG